MSGHQHRDSFRNAPTYEVPNSRPSEVVRDAPWTTGSDTSVSPRLDEAGDLLALRLAGAAMKALRVAGIVPITRYQMVKVWSGVADFSITMTFALVAENSYEDDILTPLLNLMKMQAPSQPSDSPFIRPPGPRLLPRNGVSSISALTTTVASAGTKALVFTAIDSVQAAVGVTANLTATAGKELLGAVGISSVPGIDNSINATSGFTSKQFSELTENLKQASGDIQGVIDKEFKIENGISIEIGNFMRFDSVYIESVSPAFNIVLGPNGKPMRCNVEITFSPHITPMLEDYEYIFHKTEKRG